MRVEQAAPLGISGEGRDSLSLKKPKLVAEAASFLDS
jgi:hypothetical protein